MCVDVNVHFNCSHWMGGPLYQTKRTDEVHCRKSFIKNVADSETTLLILLKCRGLHQSFSVFQSILFFYYYYLQFSLKPTVMVGDVIGSIPHGRSPASSGLKLYPVTAMLEAIKHRFQWPQLSLDLCSFFSTRTHLALHIHSAHFCIDESGHSSFYLRNRVVFDTIALLWLFVCIIL